MAPRRRALLAVSAAVAPRYTAAPHPPAPPLVLPPPFHTLLGWLTDPTKAPPGCKEYVHASLQPSCEACYRSAGGAQMLPANSSCGQCLRHPALDICEECLGSLPRIFPKLDEGFINGLSRSVPVQAEYECGAWPAASGVGCCKFSNNGGQCTDDGGAANGEQYNYWGSYPSLWPGMQPGNAALPYTSDAECMRNCTRYAHASFPPSDVCCYATAAKHTVTVPGHGEVTFQPGCYVKTAAQKYAGQGNQQMSRAISCRAKGLGFEVDDLNVVKSVDPDGVAAKGKLRVGDRVVTADIADLGTFQIGCTGSRNCCKHKGHECATLADLVAPIPPAKQGRPPDDACVPGSHIGVCNEAQHRAPGINDWAIDRVHHGIQTALHVEIEPCASCIEGLPKVDTFLDDCLVNLDLGVHCRACFRSLPHLGLDCQNCHQTGRHCDACMVHLFNFTDDCRSCVVHDLPEAYWHHPKCEYFNEVAPGCRNCFNHDLAACDARGGGAEAAACSTCNKCITPGGSAECDDCWHLLPRVPKLQGMVTSNCDMCASQMPSVAAFSVCARNPPPSISQDCAVCLARLPKVDKDCKACARTGSRDACGKCWEQASAPVLGTSDEQRRCRMCIEAYPQYFPAGPCRMGTECLSTLGVQFLWIGFSVMVLAALHFQHGVMQRGVGNGSYFPVLAFAPCAIAAMSYLTMASGMGIHLVGPPDAIMNGRVIMWPRFLDWSLSMPMQLSMLCLLAGATDITTHVKLIVPMLVSVTSAGVASVVFFQSYALIVFWVISGLSGLSVIAQLLSTLMATATKRESERQSELWMEAQRVREARAEHAALGEEEDAHVDEVNEQLEHELEEAFLYGRLAWLTVINFVCYPIVWCLSSYDIPTLDVRVVLYLVLDLIAKVYFSLVIMRVRDRVDRVGLPPRDWTAGEDPAAAVHGGMLRQWQCFLCCGVVSGEHAHEEPCRSAPGEYGTQGAPPDEKFQARPKELRVCK